MAYPMGEANLEPLRVDLSSLRSFSSNRPAPQAGIPFSCHGFRNNEGRLQVHGLAYDVGTFLGTLALPEAVEHRSPTTRRGKPVRIGAKVVRHGRHITFQPADAAIPRPLFAEILRLIDGLRPAPLPP